MRPLAWLGALALVLVFADRRASRLRGTFCIGFNDFDEDDDDDDEDEPTPDGLRPFRDALDGPV